MLLGRLSILVRSRMVTAAASLALALGTTACTRGERWNVVVVTFDTTRADKIGAYGNEAIETPNLDRLASEGVLFLQAFSAIPITTPSHSTIMTGKYPLAHGVRDNGNFVLADEQQTLAEILSERGWATGAAIGAFPLVRRFGLDQGFDFFDDRLPGPFQDIEGNRIPRKRSLFFDERRAAQVNEAAFPWLEEHAAEPFFLWLHYFDAHQPFVPPPPFDQLYADDPYSAEIAYADACFGTVLERLERLGVYDRTLIVVSGDHGEGRGDHNEMTHAILAYNSTLRVPLIVRPPGGSARVVEDRIGTVDIVPTVLDLLDIDEPDDLQGRSLVPLMEGRTPAAWSRRQQYAENLSTRISQHWGEQRVLFAGDYKYIHGPRRELFDLRADPGEHRNLLAVEPEIAAAMERGLAGFVQENAAHGSSVPEQMSPEILERLRALGYIQSGDGGGEAIVEELRTDGVAPQDRVGDINDLSRAKDLLYNDQPREARRYVARLLRGDPTNPVYLELAISVALGLGEIETAWETLNELRETYSADQLPVRVLLETAAVRFERGDQQEALELLEANQESNPVPQAQHLLANMYSLLGHPDEGRAALLKALELQPTFAPARVDLAVLEAEAGHAEEAEAHFRRVLYDEPYFPKGHFNYGAFLADQQRLKEAEHSFQRAIELLPSYARAYHGLIVIQRALGEEDAARRTLAQLVRIAPRSAAAQAARELMEEAS